MKKILLLVLLISISVLSLQAKIPNTFGNLILGQSDREEVEEFIKEHGFEIHTVEPDLIFCQNGNYNLDGVDWKYVRFEFFEEKVYSITFQIASKWSHMGEFYELIEYFRDKYSDYKHDTDFTDEDRLQVWYMDHETLILLTKTNTGNSTIIGLTYHDVALSRKYNMTKTLEDNE